MATSTLKYDNQVKAIVNVPGWVEQMNRTTKVTTESESYDLVPLVFRAVRLRANALTAIPIVVKRGDTEIENLPFELQSGIKTITLRRLLWQTEAALLISGAAYWFDMRNTVRRTGVRWLSPLYVTPEWMQNELRFRYSAPYNETYSIEKTYNSEQIVYFSEFNLGSDIEPGQSAAGVALGDSKALHHMVNFAGNFFEGGAMPVTMIGMEGNPPQGDIDNAKEMFSRMVRGVKNAFRVVAVRASTNVQTITPPISDLAMPELKSSATDSVADAFDIPLALLRDPNNRATADIHQKSFYTETVVPRANELAETINQFLAPSGYSIEFRHNEMDIFQTDEASRSSALLDLTNVLATARRDNVPTDKMMVLFDSLGYDFNEEQRAILMQEPEMVEPDAPADQEPINSIDDLAKWHNKAKKRLKAKGDGLVEFNSDTIKDNDQYRIIAEIGHCDNFAQLSAVFSHLHNHKTDIGVTDDIDPERLELENTFIPIIEQWLKDQANRIGAIMVDTEDVPESDFWQDENETLSGMLVASLAAWAAYGISQAVIALREVGLGVDADVNARASRWASRYSLRLARGLNRTTRALARAKLSNFLRDNRPIDELVDELAEIIGPRWRAELIGQTEVTKAVSEAKLEIAKEDDAIKTLIWVTARDERVCPICGPLEGEKIKKGKTFSGGLNSPPAHPRCRCTIGYEV